MRISDWSSDVCSSDLIRRAGRIGEHGALEIVCGEAVADGEGEEVDYFVRVRTDEMRAKDSPAAFLHQRLIAIHRLRDPPGRIPIGGSLALHLQAQDRKSVV